jgi:hypothetical protein
MNVLRTLTSAEKKAFIAGSARGVVQWLELEGDFFRND